jgi:hypothetical protein
MRRVTAWFVVVGVTCVVTPGPTAAADGFWVSLAAGLSGSSDPWDYDEFWFETPHAPPIAVHQLTGQFTAQATTGGGNSFFTGAGTPILLPTTDGYATLTATGNPPYGANALPKFSGSPLASGSPQPGVLTPDAHLLSVDWTSPDTDGSSVLTVGLTDPDGNPLGNGWVTVPEGGWWVIGLGGGEGKFVLLPILYEPGDDPGEDDLTDPDPIGGDGDIGDGNPVDTPEPPLIAISIRPDIDPLATPEPASLVLVGLGGLGTTAWRRLRRPTTATR